LALNLDLVCLRLMRRTAVRAEETLPFAREAALPADRPAELAALPTLLAPRLTPLATPLAARPASLKGTVAARAKKAINSSLFFLKKKRK
jgi:hypothetical protein